MHAACEGKAYDTVAALLDNKAKINFQHRQGWAPIHLVTQSRDIDCIEILCNNGADVSIQTSNGVSPLHIAAQFETPEVLNKLLEYGASLCTQDCDGDIPLFVAIRLNRNENVQALLDAEENRNDQGQGEPKSQLEICNKQLETALIVATKYDNSVATEYLLEKMGDAALNDYDILKNTPLHYAAMRNNTEICRILLEKKADPLIKNSAGRSPFALSTKDTIDYFRARVDEIQKELRENSPSRNATPKVNQVSTEQFDIPENEDEEEGTNEEKSTPSTPRSEKQQRDGLDTPKPDRSSGSESTISEADAKSSTKKAKGKKKPLSRQAKLEFDEFKKQVDQELVSIRKELDTELDTIIDLVTNLRIELIKRKKQEDDAVKNNTSA